ncbi:MAG: hypothetical protein IPM50_01420 [Acidobacteriota bacterium]|nr:MAG: hypothetical protein IPM50_01420 [Acidobacteriota bacterium]
MIIHSKGNVTRFFATRCKGEIVVFKMNGIPGSVRKTGEFEEVMCLNQIYA